MALIGLVLALAAGAGTAQTFSGSLDDPGNTALVASDLSAAVFDSAEDIANNVALYSFVVPTTELVTITSTGVAAGGVDPYFTLFSGAGSSASFVGSNYDQAFSTGGDFVYAATLAAGVYQIALGAFANMSFAENLGVGSLGDGFIGLGESYSLGDARYALNLALGGSTAPVPEPQTSALLLAGLAAIVMVRRKMRWRVRLIEQARAQPGLAYQRIDSQAAVVISTAASRASSPVSSVSRVCIFKREPRF